MFANILDKFHLKIMHINFTNGYFKKVSLSIDFAIKTEYINNYCFYFMTQTISVF